MLEGMKDDENYILYIESHLCIHTGHRNRFSKKRKKEKNVSTIPSISSTNDNLEEKKKTYVSNDYIRYPTGDIP